MPRRVYDADPTELTPDEHNANLGTKRGRDLHEKSIERTGLGRSIVVDRNGRIIAGNKTHEIAVERGIPLTIVETQGDELVVVKRTDLDLSDPTGKAREMAFADNRVGQVNLQWAHDLIALDNQPAVEEYWFPEEVAEHREMAEEEARAQAEAEGREYFGPTTGLTDVDLTELMIPDDPITAVGEMIVLGRHRLLCGDSTYAPGVEMLLEGVGKIDLVLTDPPYGVDVAAKNRFLDRMDKGSSNRVTEDLEGDDSDDPASLMALLEGFIAAAVPHCAPGSPWYVFGPSGDNLWRFSKALTDAGILRQTLAWVKNNATFAPLGVDYHWRWEPIFYGWTPGAAHRWYGARNQDTLWEYDRPHKSPDHPTMKPVGLLTRALTNSSQDGDVVYDPFAGSGSTLIGCEETGRRCYAIEIDPGYCDVVVRRWEEFTGAVAERFPAIG